MRSTTQLTPATRAASATAPEPAFVTSQLTHAPLVPEPVRRRHHCFITGDTRFAASARLLAHLWRQDQGLPAGTHTEFVADAKPRRRPANWLLRRAAAQAGATFLTPDILKHARHALLFREPGALWNEERLWGNLLSSQALTLNLLAPLALDLQLATAVWRRLLPGFVHEVTGVRFEHSPGRFQDAYFGDGTALDALIEAVTPEGEPAVIAVELKFIEALLGPAATPRPRYVEAAAESGLYRDPASPTLARPGFEQLRREHTMTSLMLRHGLAARGRFVLIAPQLNRRAQAVAALYSTELKDRTGQHDPATVGFVNLTLEQVITALHEAGATTLAGQLWSRYCDHARVARLALEDDPPRPPTPASPTLPALPPPPARARASRPTPASPTRPRSSPRPRVRPTTPTTPASATSAPAQDGEARR